MDAASSIISTVLYSKANSPAFMPSCWRRCAAANAFRLTVFSRPFASSASRFFWQRDSSFVRSFRRCSYGSKMLWLSRGEMYGRFRICRTNEMNKTNVNMASWKIDDWWKSTVMQAMAHFRSTTTRIQNGISGLNR